MRCCSSPYACRLAPAVDQRILGDPQVGRGCGLLGRSGRPGSKAPLAACEGCGRDAGGRLKSAHWARCGSLRGAGGHSPRTRSGWACSPAADKRGAAARGEAGAIGSRRGSASGRSCRRRLVSRAISTCSALDEHGCLLGHLGRDVRVAVAVAADPAAVPDEGARALGLFWCLLPLPAERGCPGPGRPCGTTRKRVSSKAAMAVADLVRGVEALVDLCSAEVRRSRSISSSSRRGPRRARRHPGGRYRKRRAGRRSAARCLGHGAPSGLGRVCGQDRVHRRPTEQVAAAVSPDGVTAGSPWRQRATPARAPRRCRGP